jgi:HlyD family secretion protein
LRISHPSGESGISRHVGDEVIANETVVAVMQPTAPGFLDLRSRQEIEAAVAAADGYVKYTESEVRRLEAAVAFYRNELARAQALSRTQTISAQALDKAKFDVESNEAALTSARAQVEWHVADGDPLDLEVVADLLSTDAVQIAPGSPVRIDDRGGPSIQDRVTRVDPAGFLKVSALGIEEQRVRTTIDFTDPPEVWSRLGHDYRVIVHVTVWKSENVLTVPVGALFRKGEDWAVFSVKDGHARSAPIKTGHRNNRTVEILAGLSEGERVVSHPSDRVREGVAVSERESQ